MKGIIIRVTAVFFVLRALTGAAVVADHASTVPPPVAVVVSVKDQRLALIQDGGLVKKYPISTSKFGLGDSYGSYKTPVGQLRVCDKIGDDLATGSVLHHRNATGEILPVNAPGRDPIVTRILWLDGEETRNANARSRGIYIHGTVEESKVGEPVSYGCIRMKSRDVMEIFDAVPVGTPVTIIEEKLPRFRKPAPARPAPTPPPAAPEVFLVKNERPAPEPASAPPRSKPAEAGPAPALRVFGDPAAPKPRVAQSPAAAPVVRPLAVPRHAVLLGEAREVASTGASARKNPAPTVEISMHGSILFADLPGAPKPAAAKPAPSAPPALPLAVLTGTVDILLGILDADLPTLPPDALTRHLLEAPEPFRLAFRTAPPAHE